MAAEPKAAAHGNDRPESRFQCNVCLDVAKDPVVTQCGHLYCWACLYQWISMRRNTCPVCKAGVTIDNVIPLYTSDSDSQATGGQPQHPAAAAQRPSRQATHEAGGSSGGDGGSAPHGSAVPPRPAGRRPDAPPQPQQPESSGATPGTWGNTQVFMGFGLFPSLMGLHFNSLWGSPPAGSTPDASATPATAAEERQRQQAAMLMQLLALVITVFVMFY